MQDIEYLKELECCELCEHRCRVNRLKNQTGLCKLTLPIIASATLHPAPPESYTVFVAGCNFKCLHCQNWSISHYPDNATAVRGYIQPAELARECIDKLTSLSARTMSADRIFFSGGEPTIHLPYIEKVIEEARKIRRDTKINFDTNGYMTEESLERILQFTTSVTYDLKAFTEEVHRALTGASSRPVLRNAKYIGKYAKDKLWEYRIVVIPKINDTEIEQLVEFVANIDADLPVCFLAFRPNFILEDHSGATLSLMEKCVNIALNAGLKQAYWSGHTDISGTISDIRHDFGAVYSTEESRRAATYAVKVGCKTHPRNCADCNFNQACQIKSYIPVRIT